MFESLMSEVSKSDGQKLMSKNWCPKSDVQKLMSKVWCPKSDVQSLMSKIWFSKRLMFKVWCSKSDVQSLMFKVWCSTSDVQNLMSEIQGGERIPKKIPDLTHTKWEHITEIRYQGDCSYQRKACISEKNHTGYCRSEIANRKQF